MKTEPTRPGANPFPALPAFFDLPSAIEANRRTLLAVADAQFHLIDRMRRSNEEMFRFLDRRLQADRETAQKLAACASLPEMWSLTMNFFQRGTNDYSQEAGLMAAVAAEQAGEALDDLRHEAEAGSLETKGDKAA